MAALTNRLSTPYPNEKYDTFNQYWVDHANEFPRRADIETVNVCDAQCLSCLQHTMTKPRGIMSLGKFKEVADKLKSHNCLIRGMYTTGNPLLDPTLFEKFAYARQIKVMAPFVSLNFTTSKLTPDMYHKILDNMDNVTLSFFAVGSEFERLTGGLDWPSCYYKALQFIRARDKYRPDFRIFIGCNAVKDSNLADVKAAFRGYNVEYAVDAELRWDGPVVTGVTDRAIMYPTFRCDGHEGVLMIKWNGNIEACSYDFKEETLYANIFTDDWETIRQKFFENWKKPFHLCSRCDYFHLYWHTKKNRFRKIVDYEWQKPFLKEGQPYQK